MSTRQRIGLAMLIIFWGCTMALAATEPPGSLLLQAMGLLAGVGVVLFVVPEEK